MFSKGWRSAPADVCKLMGWVCRRFFQLSADGSTLRWAWNKYVVMYYVEEQINDDEEREICLRLSTEPDLILRCAVQSSLQAFHEAHALQLACGRTAHGL